MDRVAAQVRLKRLSPMRAWKLSQGGESSNIHNNHGNNSSKLSEHVFLELKCATVSKTTMNICGYMT